MVLKVPLRLLLARIHTKMAMPGASPFHHQTLTHDGWPHSLLVNGTQSRSRRRQAGLWLRDGRRQASYTTFDVRNATYGVGAKYTMSCRIRVKQWSNWGGNKPGEERVRGWVVKDGEWAT
ncbi:hypothetical protein B0H14DRAFT_3171202 [Mycena olivaceomarginata]|nr:hypothetical protein B0H14DRAFT_3171202 [Mycena olivaceomarginata]